jgi:beta-phosphoglucomutase-like phosphatase (HAD superfamily)
MAISLPSGAFSALIFDCDGTLVDTAPAHLWALQQALEPLALTMTPGWYYPRVGLTPDALMDEYEAQLSGAAPSRQGIFERYNVAFQAGLHLIKEINVIAEIARDWHGRVPMAVASNGRRRNVEATLRVTKLLPLFDSIVAAEDVVHGKPEPDVFLEAARRMKVDPDRCVVFEDSNEGLEAAHRAGMRGIDIRPFYSPQRSM